jgi:hypothetical protein
MYLLFFYNELLTHMYLPVLFFNNELLHTCTYCFLIMSSYTHVLIIFLQQALTHKYLLFFYKELLHTCTVNASNFDTFFAKLFFFLKIFFTWPYLKFILSSV